MPIVKNSINVDILGFTDKVATLSTPELFGGKIKAFIERTAPRDLYDVQNMLKHSVIDENEQDLLRKTVIFYLVLGGKKKMDFPLSFDALDALKYPQIRANLMPLLKKNERFDFETAKTEVKTYLSQLMIFTDSEKMFIENFNRGVYQPDLLFDDAELIERVREHPLAAWKTKERR